MRKDTETRRLAFHATLRIFESVGWVRLFANALRADEKLIWAVSDSRNSDCGVNFVHGCHAVSSEIVT